MKEPKKKELKSKVFYLKCSEKIIRKFRRLLCGVEFQDNCDFFFYDVTMTIVIQCHISYFRGIVHFSWQFISLYTFCGQTSQLAKPSTTLSKDSPFFFIFSPLFFYHINRILITSSFLPLTHEAFQLQISNY